MNWQMNINEYIEKNSVINQENSNKVIFTMCVAPLKIVEYQWQEDDDTQHFKIKTKDIVTYLRLKGYSNIDPVNYNTIDNKHPLALTATWVFKVKQSSSNKKTSTIVPFITSLSISTSLKCLRVMNTPLLELHCTLSARTC